MPSISVIVPVYKVEAFLGRCVDSILAQSFNDFELILVDDGSPDNCGSMCDAYAAKDCRVRVIHQENGGLSAARNAGIDWAVSCSDSRWLTFVDSDDWIGEDYLKELLQAAISQDAQISACAFLRTDGQKPLPSSNGTVRCLCADDYYCDQNSDGGTPVIACCKLYKKEQFASVRYPVGKLNEDEFTTYRLVYAAGKVAVTDAVLYAYYQNPESIMRSRWTPRRLHVLEAFREQIAFARETKNERLLKHCVRNYIFAVHEQLHAADSSYHKELRAQYRQALKMGRESGAFPLTRNHLWAYEEAYPCKLFWWSLIHILSAFGSKERNP